MACKRLLRESRFVERWDEPNEYYNLTNFCGGYSYWSISSKEIVAELYIENEELDSLCIYDSTERSLVHFIDYYGIEPYTYSFGPIGYVDACPSIIKPFTYSFISVCDSRRLPICVKYIWGDRVKAVITEDLDEETEYTIARQMQSGGLNVKSAKK